MAVSVGSKVNTPFGSGVVCSKRKDGGVDVVRFFYFSALFVTSSPANTTTSKTQSLDWKLSDGKAATVHFPELDSVKPVYPEAMTPFGKGKVVSNRKDGGVNVALNWKLSDGKNAVAFLPEFLVSGTKVYTPFGPGAVSKQRKDGGVNVKLNWVLSDGKSAVAYIPDTKELKPVLKFDRELRATEAAACGGYCSIL